MGSGKSPVYERLGHGVGANVDVGSTYDMISNRTNKNQAEVDDVLSVSRDMTDKYSGSGVLPGAFQIASINGPEKETVLGYYDGNNIAINTKFMNSKRITNSYDQTVTSGYHPSRGNKSAMQAVASHEYGHALTDAVAQKMGIQTNTIDAAATRIVREAKKEAGVRSAMGLAKKISGYAKESYAECVAEAVADVYCNGSKAKGASKAIVNVIDKYLK